MCEGWSFGLGWGDGVVVVSREVGEEMKKRNVPGLAARLVP